MLRALYPFVLCLTLGLLAAMWLKPGVAQELLALAQKFRAQSPDPRAAQPGGDPFANQPYDGMPRPPTQPVPASRPVTWPGNNLAAPNNLAPGESAGVNAQPPQSGFAPPAANGFPAPPPGSMQYAPGPAQDFPEAQVAAKIGSEVVLMGDLLALTKEMLYKQKVVIPAGQEEEVYKVGNRQMLKQMLETKLVYNDAIHTIPPANFATIETKSNEMFDKTQLADLMKANEVTNKADLDAKLRARGSSIDRTRRLFFERTLAQQWLRERVKFDEPVDHSDVLGSYQQNIADYEYPAQARWEELMVRFDRFPNKAAAFAALAEMGNEVMRGVPLAEVAKARSHGLTAAEGGVNDWTTKGSLLSKEIDEAIFGLPIGSPSRIMETERGFHIVRVLERKEAGRKDFTEAQGDIKKQLKEANIKRQIDTYMNDLRTRTPVWTIYDNEPGGLNGVKE